MLNLSRFAHVMSICLAAAAAVAQPTIVEHTPGAGVVGEPASTTQREPEVPREEEAVALYFRVSFQFSYDNVAVYYTTDGSEPTGAFGTPTGTTQVLTNAGGGIAFVRNESSGGTRDWWRATLPAGARQYGQTIKYKVSAWRPFVGSEVFASGGFAFSYTNKLAWPGQGSAFPGNDDAGYPPFWAWKEEGVVGNNWVNAMIDANGNYFDLYFPGAGGVQGVSTKNEGYVDGPDTFPALLPPDNRGQMHLNQVLTGIRVTGTTYWMSNQNGVDYSNLSQSYAADSNTIVTSQRLVAGGNNILVEQADFAPKGVAYPGGGILRGMVIKRMRLTNQSASGVTANVYMYMDPALNGGDIHDSMFTDAARGAMVAFDNTYRIVTGTGAIGPGQEYNPTTFGGYEKNVSCYLAAAMKVGPVGGAGGSMSPDRWSDTSGDTDRGWIGQQVTIPAGQTREVCFLLATGFDSFAGATGTYASQVAPVIDWFQLGNVSDLLAQTDAYWQGWVNSGTTVTFPDAAMTTLFKRGLLATKLHIDERNGGLIAGFRNGAYPYVWPRDAAWAGVTLARTGHPEEVSELARFLREVAYRDFEPWGRKGFWKQKYTTDGYTVWGAPQVDETAVVPWMCRWYDDVMADTGFLTLNYAMVKDAAIASSQTSGNDPGRLRLDPAFPGAPGGQVLMYSNNVWEDSYNTFLMSNANVIRGLRDARAIANVLGQGGDAADYTNRENGLLPGFYGKLDWDCENTDISLLGVVYPFEVVSPSDFRAQRIVNRINGVWKRCNGGVANAEPLVRFPGQYINDSSDYVGLLDRYWGDSYWGNGANGPTPGGPWFLSTMWYGCYYAQRQDDNAGTADIDNLYYRVARAADHNGPLGLGAEQMAPSNSLLYPGQPDFSLQTAWPNAWESMSFYVDALMMFLDYQPDARAEVMRFEPKIPSTWATMSFHNVKMTNTAAGRTHRVSVTISKEPLGEVHTFTNHSGHAVGVETVLRTDISVPVARVERNGVEVPHTRDPVTGRVTVGVQPLATGTDAVTTIRIVSSQCDAIDFNGDGLFPDTADIDDFLSVFSGGPCSTGTCGDIDFNNDGLFPDTLDIDSLLSVFSGGLCL
ncbi:MAG TPA: hypothetical protein VHN77_12755 [Phycisphaerales bacterium]|nr:hypothetical protein [Phycisphaerales bacterium]